MIYNSLAFGLCMCLYIFKNSVFKDLVCMPLKGGLLSLTKVHTDSNESIYVKKVFICACLFSRTHQIRV